MLGEPFMHANVLPPEGVSRRAEIVYPPSSRFGPECRNHVCFASNVFLEIGVAQYPGIHMIEWVALERIGETFEEDIRSLVSNDVHDRRGWKLAERCLGQSRFFHPNPDDECDDKIADIDRQQDESGHPESGDGAEICREVDRQADRRGARNAQRSDAREEQRTGQRATHNEEQREYPIGRWESDVLVVDTIGFLPGLLGLEVAHGPKLHVVERFSLNADGTVLTREYMAKDPDYFVGEYRGSDITPSSPLPFVRDTCNAELNPVGANRTGERK